MVIIGPLSGRNAGTEVGLKRDSMADTQAGREAGRCGPLRAVEPQNVLKSSKITPNGQKWGEKHPNDKKWSWKKR